MGNSGQADGSRAGGITPTIGLVAHDAKKEELALFARAHRTLLGGVRLIAPEDTARALEEAGVGVEALAPEHGPLSALAGEPDVRMMLKVCDVERVPVATNLASAEIVLHALVACGLPPLPSKRFPYGRRRERSLGS